MGTNDVLHHGDMTASDAARGVEVLARMALASETGPAERAPGVLIISPPRIRMRSPALAELCHGDPERSAGFSRFYREMADARQRFSWMLRKSLNRVPLTGCTTMNPGSPCWAGPSQGKS